MNKLSTLMILFVALFIGSQSTFAQEDAAKIELNEIAANKTEELSAILELNSEQSSLTQKAFMMYEVAIDRLKINDGTPADYKHQVARLKKNMNTILNEEQYINFEEILTEKNIFVYNP